LIAAWHSRLKQVTITNGDRFSLLERIKDQPRMVIYCDPPYVEKSEACVHDIRRDDHAQLVNLARRFKPARIVISYDEHPELRRLYRGWTFVPIAATKQRVNQGR
jgi:DNA adenine methylase